MDSPTPPVTILKALASERRWEIVRLLCIRPRSVVALCDRTRQSQPAVSKHLKVLREAGLVNRSEVRGDRRKRIYRVRESALVEVEDWLETLSPARGRVSRRARRDAGAHDLRDTPYTTRGTPRIRKRLYWRQEDAEAAERGDPEWLEKEMAKTEREFRAAVARGYRTRRHL